MVSSIGELHGNYITFMNDHYPNEEKVTQRFYHTVFTRDYNIVFQPPTTDVCTTCEKLAVCITNGKSEGKDASHLEQQLLTHKAEAKVPRDLKKEEDAPLTTADNDIRVVAMDL